ncbi:SDR family NAD(P)-dependent oxidoreductase [Jannaschia sp. Os4]|uniref:SDR family NAD(P)-dependent oxidoreductase n=1 Tax=Jannaschia sp. Os4 TaxID=2807617 RepID=UPI00193A6846|nr:SDR family NAD(P)-dependent oxidoreductase [Jannaschia sp. Os4]MBM2575955.1 SDR family NAD(P)-dependent oxidoreductase [Jannaschia sp. Os4]
MNIEGIGAIVVGGGSGLGAATARHLAERGADVTVVDRDGDRAAQVAAEVLGHSVQADVSVAEEVAAAVTTAMARFGQAPRLAVNCAGIADAARIVGREGKTSVPLFRRVIEVNLIGTYNVMSYAAQGMMDLPPLETGERGVIVNTASIAYEDGQMGQTAYAASKGGVAAMSLPAAREMARMGVRVCAIAPGLFETPMMAGLPEDVVAGITANVQFPPRLGAPEEYARLVAHIAENSYLNGETIRLDGATRLPPR